MLRHPTSLAFLSHQGVVAYLPAAIISAAFGALGHLRCTLQTMWGHEIRSNKEQSFLLLDIVQNVTARAGLDRDNTLNERQQAWIASMVSKIRAIENPDDCGPGNE